MCAISGPTVLLLLQLNNTPLFAKIRVKKRMTISSLGCHEKNHQNLKMLEHASALSPYNNVHFFSFRNAKRGFEIIKNVNLSRLAPICILALHVLPLVLLQFDNTRHFVFDMPHFMQSTPPNFRECARQKVPAKCFKICHILYIRKSKGRAFPIFHFVLLYFFA